jgi:pilus assembly protein Flp/PilA
LRGIVTKNSWLTIAISLLWQTDSRLNIDLRGPLLPHFGKLHMKTFALKVQRFLVSEDGPTAVEYAVMLALIIVVCLTAISAIGTNANATFNSVASKLPAGGGT